MSEENKKETICRVNISITPELHERYKELAKSHFGSFSHLVREAIEYMINRAEGGGYRAELTPVIERLNTLLKQFGAFEKSVAEMKSSLKAMVLSEVGEERRIASVVQGVLSREEGLTIQEIAAKSRLSIREVISGLGVLEDNFLVEREEPANLAGFIKWKIKR